jgi:hypothetical protein
MKMHELLNEEFCFITEDEFYEMARVTPDVSGINVEIFVSPEEYVHQRHFVPRLKVSNIRGTFSKSENFVVSIEDAPRVVAGECKFDRRTLKDIYDFVKMNKTVLLDFWNSRIKSHRELLNQLQPIHSVDEED